MSPPPWRRARDRPPAATPERALGTSGPSARWVWPRSMDASSKLMKTLQKVREVLKSHKLSSDLDEIGPVTALNMALFSGCELQGHNRVRQCDVSTWEESQEPDHMRVTRTRSHPTRRDRRRETITPREECGDTPRRETRGYASGARRRTPESGTPLRDSEETQEEPLERVRPSEHPLCCPGSRRTCFTSARATAA